MPHIHEKIDFTAEVFVVFKDRVLLRKHDKYKIWLAVGGHIELDEDPNQAAVREVKEEVGLDVRLVDKSFSYKGPEDSKELELMPPKFVNRHRINERHEHVTMIYFGVSKTDDIKQGEGELSDEIKWFTEEELNDENYGIRDNIRHYAKKALEELKGLNY